jgi:hypothetical protein
MPTVIPARGLAGADGGRLGRGVALLVPGEARIAAGEAAASPATPGPVPLGPVPLGPAPPEPVAVLAQAVTRQAVARQATTASKPAWLARVNPVLPVRSGSLSAPRLVSR